jgi:hypothetical protein
MWQKPGNAINIFRDQERLKLQRDWRKSSFFSPSTPNDAADDATISVRGALDYARIYLKPGIVPADVGVPLHDDESLLLPAVTVDHSTLAAKKQFGYSVLQYPLTTGDELRVDESGHVHRQLRYGAEIMCTTAPGSSGGATFDREFRLMGIIRAGDEDNAEVPGEMVAFSAILDDVARQRNLHPQSHVTQARPQATGKEETLERQKSALERQVYKMRELLEAKGVKFEKPKKSQVPKANRDTGHTAGRKKQQKKGPRKLTTAEERTVDEELEQARQAASVNGPSSNRSSDDKSSVKREATSDNKSSVKRQKVPATTATASNIGNTAPAVAATASALPPVATMAPATALIANAPIAVADSPKAAVSAATGSVQVKWYWAGDLHIRQDVWIEYSTEIALEIETGWQAGDSIVSIDSARYIDLQVVPQVQCRYDDPFKQRKVERREEHQVQPTQAALSPLQAALSPQERAGRAALARRPGAQVAAAAAAAAAAPTTLRPLSPAQTAAATAASAAPALLSNEQLLLTTFADWVDNASCVYNYKSVIAALKFTGDPSQANKVLEAEFEASNSSASYNLT